MIRYRKIVLALCAALVSFAATGHVSFAHDEIESSVPAHQSQFDDPISEVTIEFGAPVGGVELALVGPNDEDLDGEVVRIDSTSARLVFPPLSDEGQYLVRYLAEEDGHLVNGAITFVYGSRAGTGSGSSTTWLLFGAASIAILAVGAFWTWRLSQRADSRVEPASA